MTQPKKDEDNNDKPQGSLLGSLLAQGREMLGGIQEQAEAQLKQQQTQAGELAQGLAQEVVGSVKVTAGEAFGQAALVEQGRAEEVAGQARQEQSGAAAPLQQAGDAVVEKTRGALGGLAASARAKLTKDDDKAETKDG